jgi:hypothetical protein
MHSLLESIHEHNFMEIDNCVVYQKVQYSTWNDQRFLHICAIVFMLVHQISLHSISVIIARSTGLTMSMMFQMWVIEELLMMTFLKYSILTSIVIVITQIFHLHQLSKNGDVQGSFNINRSFVSFHLVPFTRSRQSNIKFKRCSFDSNIDKLFLQDGCIFDIILSLYDDKVNVSFSMRTMSVA